MIKSTLEYRVAHLEHLLFNEAKQVGILYHVCTLEAYLKYIYPTDTLKASGTFNNKLYKGRDYVSFTRDQHFVVEIDSKHNILIQLVIDGDKLSEHYKIGPYNYYAFPLSNRDIYSDQDKFGDLASSEEDNEDSFIYDDPKNRQQEEVVKGPIKNLSKYIKEIRFCFTGEIDSDTINFLEKCKSQLSNCIYVPFVQNGMAYRRSNRLNGKAEFFKSLRKGYSVDDVVSCYNNYVQSVNTRQDNFEALTSAIKEFNYKEVDTLLHNDNTRAYFQKYGGMPMNELVTAYVYSFNQENGKCKNPNIVNTFKAIIDNNIDVTKFTTYHDCYSYRPSDIFNALPKYGGFYIKNGTESEVAKMIKNASNSEI